MLALNISLNFKGYIYARMIRVMYVMLRHARASNCFWPFWEMGFARHHMTYSLQVSWLFTTSGSTLSHVPQYDILKFSLFPFRSLEQVDLNRLKKNIRLENVAKSLGIMLFKRLQMPRSDTKCSFRPLLSCYKI